MKPFNHRIATSKINIKKCKYLVISLIVIICIITINNPLFAKLPPLIPRQILFENPERTYPHISPDGKYLSYMASDKNNVLQIWIRTLGQQDDWQVTANKNNSIYDYFWAYNGKQLIYLEDFEGNENYQLYSVNIHTKEIVNLTPFKNVKAQIIALAPKFANQILVGLNLKDSRKHDIYRINLQTGQLTLDTENPVNNLQSIADPNFQIRATINSKSDAGASLAIRNTINQPWKEIRRWGPDDIGKIVGFSQDGQTLYVLTSYHANTTRLLALNLTTGFETVIAQDPQYDVSDVFINPVTQKIQAVAFYRDKLEWQVLDKSIADDFQALSKVRSGEFQVLDLDTTDKIWLVSYNTDNGPTYYYKYNRTTKKSKLLFSNQPKLEGLPLAKMQPISYKSRDGLRIHGYLTTPPGIAAKNLPVVLLVHGGPWKRDTWGYDDTVQWLANRGYAVLQVNFRGSTGYGKEFLNAGNREWGGKMHDDLIDGVNWIIKQGIANPKKVAIMGASYGGYATLVGLTFTPNIFAAGVSIVGPSNLLTLLQSLPAYWESELAMFYRRVGNPKKEPEFLKSRSPLFFVDQIKAPLLIAQGANDPRVKLAESEQIVTAMRKANKSVKYILYPDEGHGFDRPENRLHFFSISEEFLSRYLGGRIQHN